MKGIIVGGGIGGLTLGVALHQAGIDATVYEAAPEIKPVGAGIILGTNAMLVLKALGLEDQIRAAGQQLKNGAVAALDGSILQNMPFAEMEAHFNVTNTAIHRGKLQQILIDALPASKFILGKRAASVVNSSQPTVHFDDGTSVSGDFLVGADGIHSVVRQAIFPTIQKRYSGQTCWRGIVEMQLSQEKQHQVKEYWDKQGRFAAIQIAENLVYWYAVQTSDAGQKDNPSTVHQDLIKTFNVFDDASEIISKTSVSKILRGDLYDLKPSKVWHQSNIVLVGDAIHATTPNLGQGGAQAIEDGLALARCFEKYEDLETVFKTFTKLRSPKANMVIRQSKLFGDIAHWQNPIAIGLRNTLLKNSPTKPFIKQFMKLYDVNY